MIQHHKKNDFIEQAIIEAGDRCNDVAQIKTDLAEAFEKLKLPMPKDGEFHNGVGNLGVVFMNQAGCVLRLVLESEFPLLRHLNVMRPIGSIRIGETARLDVQYAGLCPAISEDTQKVQSIFAEAGIEDEDITSPNLCYADIKNTMFPNGIPVQFDVWELKTLNQSVRNISALFDKGSRILDLSPTSNETPDEQDTAYQDLREGFKRIFDIEQSVKELIVYPEAVDNFWKSMKKAKHSDRLKTSWLDGEMTAKFKEIPEASRAYDAHLREHNPIFV